MQTAGGKRLGRFRLVGALAAALRRRQLRALTVSTTEVSTGRTVVFMQTSPDSVIPATAPPRTLYRADHIGPHHALASAACTPDRT